MGEVLLDNLARNVKQLRKERGISENKLGLWLGVTGKHVLSLESRHREFSAPHLVRLTKEFNVSFDELFKGEVNAAGA